MITEMEKRNQCNDEDGSWRKNYDKFIDEGSKWAERKTTVKGLWRRNQEILFYITRCNDKRTKADKRNKTRKNASLLKEDRGKKKKKRKR